MMSASQNLRCRRGDVLSFLEIMDTQYSVLLSLYYKEKPEYLRESLDSVFSQTLLSDDVVLVEDGEVGDALECVVREYEGRYPQLHVVRFAKNRGLGAALNDGLKYCKHELVARMDTDDIAKPYRMERQVKFMWKHPEIAAVGSWIEEFRGGTNNIVSLRKLPEHSNEIFDFGKKRNPLNHPTVMFRKEEVMKVDGYKPFRLFEDYYLWVRMMVNGARFYNIQESLLLFRTSPAMYNRRGGLKYALNEASFLLMMQRMGYIGLMGTIQNLMMRMRWTCHL